MLLLALFQMSAFAQPTFIRTYGNATFHEAAKDLFINEFQEIYLAGYHSNLSTSIESSFLYRLNNVGDTLATAYYTRGDGFSNYMESIVPRAGGGAYVGSMGEPNPTRQTFMVWAADTLLDLVWDNSVGRMASQYDEEFKELVRADSGLIAFGSARNTGPGFSQSNLLIVEFDSLTGAVRWHEIIGANGHDVGKDVVYTNDSAFIMVGYTNSFGAGNLDIYCVDMRYDRSLIRTRTFGGAAIEEAFAVTQTRDGGFAIAGRTSSFGAGGNDGFIAKMDRSFNIEWSKTIGGTGEDYFYEMTEMADGDLTAVGFTDSFGGGGRDIFAVQVDSLGALQWAHTFGSTGTEMAWSVKPASDGGVYIAGQSDSPTLSSGNLDALLIKTNAAGEVNPGCHSVANVIINDITFSVDSGGTTSQNLVFPLYSLNRSTHPITPTIACGTTLPDAQFELFAGITNDHPALHWKDLPTQTVRVEIEQQSPHGDFTYWDEVVTFPEAVYAYEFTSSVSPDGFFRVIAIDRNGVEHVSNVVEISAESFDWRIYPQPAENVIHIQIPSETHSVKATLYGPRGETVLQQTVTEQRGLSLDCGHLPRGIYLLSLQADHRRQDFHRIVLH